MVKREPPLPLPAWVINAAEFTSDWRHIPMVHGEPIALATMDFGIPCIRVASVPYLFTRMIKALTYGFTFVNGVRMKPDGKSLDTDAYGRLIPVILQLKQGERGRVGTVVWEGSATIIAAYRAWNLAPDRRLTEAEWGDYLRIRRANRGGHQREANVAVMDFRQPLSRATWADRCGFLETGRLSELKTYLLCQVSDFDGDAHILLRDQGPIWLPDGSHIFASRSGVFDSDGTSRGEIAIDLSGIAKQIDYFDITPRAEITDECIIAGCRELIAAYDECPAYPEIPAAIIGQICTSPVVATHHRYFAPILLTGMHGSGKTYLSLRYDSIQSRTMRGDLDSITPAINLGDTSGTLKGPAMRIKDLGGFAFTIDDVIQEGMSAFNINKNTETLNIMIRSFESGGGTQGGVDHAANKQVSRQKDPLQSSVRATSERPIAGEGTLERMIVLPHLTAPWGKGGIFDTTLAKRLSTADSRELQHLAWSAYVHWMFQRIDTELAECHREATHTISSWNVTARTSRRYTALVTGQYMFARFCHLYDIDITEQVSLAVKALEGCAIRQAKLSVPVAVRFRKALGELRTIPKVAFPGPPIVDPDGVESGVFSEPWITSEITKDDGTIEVIRKMPMLGINLSDLGLTISGRTAVPNSRATVLGYTIPPRKDQGGKEGNSLTRKWLVACRSEQFKYLCKLASNDRYTFDPDDVVASLQQELVGDRIRVCIGKTQERATVIDFEWLFTQTDDSEDT